MQNRFHNAPITSYIFNREHEVTSGRPVSLKHALLGWLSLEPSTGYDLKAKLDHSTQYFWRAELSQIYPTLKTMLACGEVEMTVEHQKDRPSRKIYSITPEGEAELKSWLATPAEPSAVRDSFIIRIFFGSRLEPEVLLDELREQRDHHARQLSHYETEVRSRIEQITTRLWPQERPFWELTLDRAVIYERGYVEFCDKAIERLQQTAEPDR